VGIEEPHIASPADSLDAAGKNSVIESVIGNPCLARGIAKRFSIIHRKTSYLEPLALSNVSDACQLIEVSGKGAGNESGMRDFPRRVETFPLYSIDSDLNMTEELMAEVAKL
jgi:hypothetical protein